MEDSEKKTLQWVPKIRILKFQQTLFFVSREIDSEMENVGKRRIHLPKKVKFSNN